MRLDSAARARQMRAVSTSPDGATSKRRTSPNGLRVVREGEGFMPLEVRSADLCETFPGILDMLGETA